MNYPIDLHLTTPHMHGTKVEEAQRLLKHNRYSLDFDPGSIDGEYGTHTAAAAYRAKWLLGYPRRQVNHTFGPRLYSYLVPKQSRYYKSRSATYWPRAKLRQAAWRRHQQTSFRTEAAHIAASQEGVHETPAGSNNVAYNTWYYGHPVYGGSSYPWCAVFVSWCYTRAGRPLHYASVAQLYYDAYHHRNGLSLVGTPERGDIACVEHLDHAGIYQNQSAAGSIVYTSGNTSGGMVDTHSVSKSIVNGYVRVNR
jgi:hypothetical protein